jgi:fructose-1,6-bisphosphatase/inositol monophosphatase family enzyme
MAESRDVAAFLVRARQLIRELLPDVLSGCGNPGSNVQTKRDGSLVTSIDTQVERTLKGGFSALFPGVPILAEESAIDVSSGTQLSAAEVYASFFTARDQITIDPIDGTRNFVEGRREYCIAASLSSVEGGGIWPQAGVVAVPHYGQMFWCDERTAYVEEIASGSVVTLSRVVPEQRVLSASSRDRAWLESSGNKLTLPWQSSGSSVYDLVGTVTGRLSASIIGAQRLWDIMAPLAIATRMGLVVRDIQTKQHVKALTAADLSSDIVARPWGLGRKMVLLPPELSISELIQPVS